VQPGEKVMLVDDLLATGGTSAAAVKLLTEQGAEIVAISFLIELSFLHGREKLAPHPVKSILKY
jgi:adenine phosphoribosyltransferase